jgi:hypothetical protein
VLTPCTCKAWIVTHNQILAAYLTPLPCQQAAAAAKPAKTSSSSKKKHTRGTNQAPKGDPKQQEAEIQALLRVELPYLKRVASTLAGAFMDCAKVSPEVYRVLVGGGGVLDLIEEAVHREPDVISCLKVGPGL